MGVTKESFGVTCKGDKVTLYKITNANGLVAEVIDFGAILKALYVPDKNGENADIVLGYNSITPYEYNGCFFGSTIGRNANRIADAKFTINGKEYKLAPNDNDHNNLHSDFDTCFNKKMWTAEIIDGENAVKFSLESPDGDQGFPGNLKAGVVYRLTDDNVLELEYTAVSDQDTVYNPTNHTYFNLAGESAGREAAMAQKLYLKCSNYTPADDESIPYGRIEPVAGTPFDFTTATAIGDRINNFDFEQLKFGKGYDHNFVIDKTEKGVELCAILTDEKSGRRMTTYTDLPGVQFYAGNCISYQYGKTDKAYGKRCGVCLETQYFPNAINEKNFASPLLKAGEQFHSITRYAFDIL